ncbi:unnamed protein product, partial [Meganyctiphanes norvegica]
MSSAPNRSGSAPYRHVPNPLITDYELRKSLEQHINFDVYGTTGTFTCGTGCRARNGQTCDRLCRDMIAKKYKFYFAFEPSLCKYWATEKLFTFLQRPIVPVFWGGTNVSLIAPPHSFINALDFYTVKDLTDYLKYLDQNVTAYNEYFKWKQHYGVVAEINSMKLSFCSLCAHLNNDNRSSSYENLHNWWTNEQCRDPNSAEIRTFLNISSDVKLRFPADGEEF